MWSLLTMKQLMHHGTAKIGFSLLSLSQDLKKVYHVMEILVEKIFSTPVTLSPFIWVLQGPYLDSPRQNPGENTAFVSVAWEKKNSMPASFNENTKLCQAFKKRL